MRRYELKIAGTTSATYASQVNGQNDPGALNIEFDVPQYNFAAPIGYAHIKVWGVSLATIGQGSDFNAATVDLSAGMASGFPLATLQAPLYGPILHGTVFQAYGNWVGLEQCLILVVTTDGGASISNPANIVVNWPKGTKMADAVQQTLQTAYPGYTVNINISDLLVLGEDEVSQHWTLLQLGQYLYDTSKSINTDPTYAGVNISLSGTTITVQDGTTLPTAIAIRFEDMIGQPTWIGPGQVQVSLVMRSDITVGATLTFPQTQQTLSEAQMGTQPQDKSAFSTGTFSVTAVRSVGNFRHPDGLNWITVVNAISAPLPATTQDTQALPDNQS